MAYTITNVYALGPEYTGVSLRAQLYDSSNGAVGSALSTGFYERAGAQGVFAHTLSVPDSHVGWCDVYVNGASSLILATIPINPQELENADVKTSTRGTLTAAQVWDALTSGLATANSIGKLLTDNINATISSRSTLTAANVWDALTSGLTTVGSIGKRLADNVDAAISSRSTFAGGAVASVTGNVGGNVVGSVGSVAGAVGSVTGNVGGNVTGSVGSVVGAVGSVTGAVGSVTGNVGGNVTGSVGSLATQAKADVNAEADQALIDVGVTTTVTGRIDATISSRLAGGSYTTPPTVTAIRTEMDTNSTKLANLDATVSSRSTLTAAGVWANGTRTLSSFGTLIADIWAVAQRTITGGTIDTNNDKTGYSLAVAPPTAAEIDTQLSGVHGAGSWATATGFATPTNVSNAQTAIEAAIAALNNLSQSQAANAALAALNAYDPPTATELGATETALANAIAALNNLSQAQAQAATTAALNAYDPPTKAELDTAQAAIIAAQPAAASIVTAVMAYAVETGHDMTTVMRALYAATRGKAIANDPIDPTEIDYYAPDGTTVRVHHDLTNVTREPA